MSTNPYYRPAKLSAINKRSAELWQDLLDHENEYMIKSRKLDCGAVVLDMGVHETGSLEAGRILTELCQGGLSKAHLSVTDINGIPLPEIVTETMHPGAGCMDMQMGITFPNALLSGPIRLFIEPLRFVTDDIPLSEANGAKLALVEPYAHAPEFGDEDVMRLCEMAHVDPKDLKIILAPNHSLAGSTQVCGRAGEDAMLTIQRCLMIDSSKVVSVIAKSPICPLYDETPGTKRLDCDDFLHYVSDVYMTYYSEPGEEVAALCRNLTFETLDVFGSYWGDMLDAADGDFFKIPNITGVNRIGKMTVNDLRTGKVYSAGTKRYDLIAARLLAE